MFSWLRKVSQEAREPSVRPREDAGRVEADLDSRRRALGVEDALGGVPSVTAPMLVAFGESGVKTVEDLAGCATDDLAGWTDTGASAPVKHPGILDGIGVSRGDCEAMIMHARVMAGWIEAP
jgi:transcription termination/antitermination protein NusA